MEEREYNENGIGDTSDSLVESQSTQLLDFVLGRTEPELNNNNASVVMNEEAPSSGKHSTTTTSSTGEVALSVGSVVSYHLHGLADTQSETQYIASEGSQKENEQSPNSLPPSAPLVGASKSLSSVHPAPTTRLKPSRALTSSALDPLSVFLPSRPDDTNRMANKNTKTSFRPLSVRKAPLVQKPYSKPPAMRFRRRPSPTNYSQDSFAGPTASQDPDLFLARSKQFEIPLDQLGLSNSQEESPPQAQSEENSGDSTGGLILEERRNHEEEKYSMTSYTSTSNGTVLVANSDSSGPSQDTSSPQILVSVSISQEPTQILGDLSDRSSNFSEPDHASYDREKEAEVATQIIGEGTQSQEPTQPLEPTQEATQLLADDSIGQGETSPNRGTSSLLDLVAPEKRHRYMHHYNQKSDAASVTSQMPGGGVSTTIGSHSGKSRSLLSTLAPEKRSRYMHHFKGQGESGSGSVSEASRMATYGTSSGSGSGGTGSREIQHQPQEGTAEKEDGEEEAREEVVPDSIIMQSSVAQVKVDLSPVKPFRTRIRHGERVIPPSESDVPDCSKEEEEEEEDVDEVEALANKPPSGASVKGKERATTSPLAVSPQKSRPTSKKSAKSPAVATTLVKTPADGPSKKTPVVNLDTNVPVDVFPTPAKSPATRSKATAIDKAPVPLEDVELSPLSDLPQSSARRGRGRRGAKADKAKSKSNKQDLAESSTTKVNRRELRSTTPALLPEIEEGGDQESPEVPLAKLAADRHAVREMEEEEETEIADDEEMNNEADEESVIGEIDQGPSNRKRKRTNTTTSRRGGKAKATARKVNTRATSTAQAPPLKRTKTEPGTFESAAVATIFGAGLGTQVFALFKSDSSFYGAEVQSLSGTRAHVKFFDDLDEPNIGVEQMRRFELRTGDVVIPGQGTYKARVVDDTRWASDNEVDAVYLEGPNEEVQVVLRAPDIRIPARIIQSQWEGRTLHVSEIIPAIARKTLKDTPSPSKGSLLSIQPTRNARNRLLSKYGIVISLGPGNGKWAETKEKYTSIVKENGGTVLPDWLDLFSLQGKHCNGNKRWIIQRTDVRYAPKDKGLFDRVFLVADAFNQKPSYLLALALGIPCVSLEWLDYYASGKEVPWTRFLLAAGHSEPLGAAVSQMVDFDWGTTSEHLTDITENRVPQKVLSKASVLCLGAELLPFPVRKTTDAARASAPSRIVPRIVLAMGAEFVEAVADAKHASKGLEEFDYVVVKDSKALPMPYVDGVTYVDITWVKECLIAGRLLPVPDSE